MFSKEHMNIYTIFQSAQLLQRLSAFQWTRLPFHELQERVPPEPVDTLMTKIFYLRRIAGVGDRSPGKIKCAPACIDNHFDLVWRGCFGAILERMRGSDDIDLAIRPEFFDDPVD